MVERCLRAKAKRRPSDVADLRRELERRVGSPSPTDAREHIADHLWDPILLAAEKEETVQIGTDELERLQRTGRRRVHWWRHALDVAALMLVLFVGTALFWPEISTAVTKIADGAGLDGTRSSSFTGPGEFWQTAGEKLGLRRAGLAAVDASSEETTPQWTDEALAQPDTLCVSEDVGR
jgi:hypothetical protein